ncbi:MAG: GntR family transcriptional regulator [Candidatus Hydrogenedentota bacterium]|uniref:Transcriptional regulator, GntR family n=1 Tax=Sumerlaea chitinivorans TaxID=2250252 RepID=A0A2Z4Y312_SUMC1|nr:Transcriptional regulator, GntR family [Candidatus Sumerlaea chitinivorans]RMH29437.1 MAG: GntR family transcriptional regulator [Candidatus Hydrogenedentota bacterium]
MTSDARYIKLYRLLRSQIERGRFQPGQLFYSQNELMRKFRLSYSTVSHALDQLERDGLIARKQGKGTFVQEHFEPAGRAVTPIQHRVIEVYYQPPRFEFDYVPPDAIFLALQPSVPHPMECKLNPYPADSTALYESVLRPHIAVQIFYDPPSSLAEFIADASAVHPVLVVGKEPLNSETLFVSLDFSAAGKLAAKALCPTAGEVLGALLPESPDTPSMQQLLGGLRESVIQQGATLKPEFIYHATARSGGGYRAMLDLFNECQGQLPDGIVLVGTELTYGALTALSTALNTQRFSETLKLVAIAWPAVRYPWTQNLPTVLWPPETIAQHILSIVHCLSGHVATSPLTVTPTECIVKGYENEASPPSPPSAGTE